MVDDKADDVTDTDANHTTRKSDCTGFHQEYAADIRQRASQNLHDADLTGTFIDRHDHGIGNRERRDEKADCAKAAEDHLLDPESVYGRFPSSWYYIRKT